MFEPTVTTKMIPVTELDHGDKIIINDEVWSYIGKELCHLNDAEPHWRYAFESDVDHSVEESCHNETDAVELWNEG